MYLFIYLHVFEGAHLYSLSAERKKAVEKGLP